MCYKEILCSHTFSRCQLRKKIGLNFATSCLEKLSYVKWHIMGNVWKVVVPNVAKRPQILFLYNLNVSLKSFFPIKIVSHDPRLSQNGWSLSNGRFYNICQLYFQPLSISHTLSLSVSPAASLSPFFLFEYKYGDSLCYWLLIFWQ